MILYFSGTGNSKYVADFLADKLSDCAVSLNEILKNKLEPSFESEKPFVWVAPIYAWRFPKNVDKLFEKTVFKGSKKIYFVATMGGDSGNCIEFCKKMTKEKGLDFGGFADVIMPDNYYGGFEKGYESTAKEIIKASHPVLSKIAAAINGGSPLLIREKSSMAKLKSGFVNYGFSKFMIANTKFTLTSSCNSCGICEKNCPANNISLKSGKPVFEKNCMGCYSCIHRCPQKAINFGKKTENKGRYICVDYRRETE